MGKIRENWKIIVFTALITMSFSTMGALVLTRENKLSGAASTEYVDKQDSAIGLILISHESKISTLDAKIDTKADKADMYAVRVTVDDIYKLLLQMATQKQIERAESK